MDQDEGNKQIITALAYSTWKILKRQAEAEHRTVASLVRDMIDIELRRRANLSDEEKRELALTVAQSMSKQRAAGSIMGENMRRAYEKMGWEYKD